MPEARSDTPSGATNDTWRTWLMTGVRRDRVDRRRMRGANKGLKKMLLEGMHNGGDRPRAWNDFSGAMIRHAVDEAIRALPNDDEKVVKLAYFGGCSNREIASRVGLTEGTVQRRLRRALGAISEHIQHGRTQARRAMYVVTIWLTGRWLQESAHHVVQAAVVMSAAVIIVAQPPATAGASRAQPAQSPANGTPATPLVPSPAVPVLPGRVPAVQPPMVDVPVKVPVTLPALPTPVTVRPPAL
jgi:RNA polymerase sigma factor (sigma-70 family)